MSNSRPPYDGAGDAGQNPQQPGFSQGNYPPAQGYAPNGGYAPNDAYGQGYAPQTAMGSSNMVSRGMRTINSPMVSRDTSSHTVSRNISSHTVSKVISSRMGRAMSSRMPSSLISSSRMTSRGLCSLAGISSPTSSRGISSRIRRTISRVTASRIRRKRICRRSSSTRSTPRRSARVPDVGRSGFRVQPAAHREIPWDTIAKVLMFGVLPILFILSMVFAWTAVKWVVLVGAVASIAAMWLRELVTPNARLVLSLLLASAAVVCLVSALATNASDNQNPAQPNQSGQMQQGSTSGNNLDVNLTATDTPNPAPTPTATPVDDSEECYAQLHSFFTLWKNNAISQMVNLTAPSWRSSIKGGTDAVTQKLFGEVLTNRTPVSWDFTAITGTSNDIARMVTVRAVINKNNTLGESVYLWKVRMVKEDGVWYVDPATLQSNEQESTATPTNALATQPVLNTSHPDLLIYYNPEGGTYYHIDPNCESLNPKYRPLSGVIKWSQIEDDPYDKLEQCKRCGAPLREKRTTPTKST